MTGVCGARGQSRRRPPKRRALTAAAIRARRAFSGVPAAPGTSGLMHAFAVGRNVETFEFLFLVDAQTDSLAEKLHQNPGDR